MHIDEAKVKAAARYDGKWMLRTNRDLSAEQVALKYKQLWQVERVFRDVKSLLLTRWRPVRPVNRAPRLTLTSDVCRTERVLFRDVGF